MNLVVFLLGLFYLSIVSAEVPVPDEIYGWKFVQRSNKLCYIERYHVSTTHGTEKKEPLRNYVPEASYPINCYDGHTVHTMNILYTDATSPNPYNMAICFFLPKENQRFVCKYLKNAEFYIFAEKECNNSKLEKNDFQFFGIAYYYKKNNNPREAGYVTFYSGFSDDDACEYDNANNAKVGRGGDWFNQFDSEISEHNWLYRNDTYVYSVFDDNVVRYDKKTIAFSISTNKDAETKVYFENEFDHMHYEIKNFDFKAYHSFVGYKYVKTVDGCFIETEIVESMRSNKYPIKCYENLNGYGMNIEWDMTAQKGHLRTCFVINEPMIGPKLVCHLVTYGNTTEIDLDYNFDKCRDHLLENKVVNVIVGGLKDESSTMKAIYIETDSKLCKYDAETESDELLEREKYSFGYDPYQNSKIVRDSSGKVNGVDIKAHEKALILSCGVNTLVKTSDKEWIVIDRQNKVDKKTNWNYDFVVEESASLALDI